MDKKTKVVYTIGAIGALVGLGYAFKTKKGFWGYVGFSLLGSLMGNLVGNVIAMNMKDENPTTDTTNNTTTNTTTQNATKESVGNVSVSPITPKGVSQSDIESILKK